MKALLPQTSHSKSSITRRRLRGAAAVEFAVVAPLFLLLLGGIIEGGQAFRIQHAISNASRRGARAAIVDGASSIQVAESITRQCSQTLRVDETAVTVVVAVNGDSSIDLSRAAEQDEISVTVSIPYAKAGAGFFANTFSNCVLNSTCILEHE